jgi:MerR family transcriptional regulator, mercuric resistance operon regulatory protein
MPSPIKDMTIAKLARAAEVGVETVRYYQRRGLMPVPRAGGQKGTTSGFRHYDQAHLQTLRFIRRAQAAGFTLQEIKELLSLDRTRDRARIRVLAGGRLEALARQAAEIEESRQALQRLLGACQGSNRGPCPIIEAFSP